MTCLRRGLGREHLICLLSLRQTHRRLELWSLVDSRMPIQISSGKIVKVLLLRTASLDSRLTVHLNSHPTLVFVSYSNRCNYH